MFKRILFVAFCIVICWPNLLQAQSTLAQIEESMAVTIDSIVRAQSVTEKNRLNSQFVDQFEYALRLDGAFEYPFSSLKNIGSLVSPDRLVRIFTWNIPQNGGTQRYFGFLVVKGPNGVLNHRLIDSRDAILNPQMEVVTPFKWYGALYYQIQQEIVGSRTLYLLLGVDMNNTFSTRRVIEVLWFNNQGEPQLGAPAFRVKNSILNRIIFEYSARTTMMLRYSSEHGMIVFDHLSPLRPDMVGNYQFYGPDFSYDGFKFENGIWVYVADIDLRNMQQEKPKAPIVPPEKNPEPGFLYKPNIISPEKNR